MGVTNTGTFTKKPSPLQVLYEPSKRHMGHVPVSSEMPCSPCWVMKHLLCKLSMLKLFASFPQPKPAGKANRPVLCY